MNKKLTFLVCLLAIFGLRLSAQNEMHFGVFTGGSINMMNINKSFYYDDDKPITIYNYETDKIDSVYFLTVNGAKVKPNGGFILGGLFEYKVNDMLGLQFELFYNQYGYNITGTVDKKNQGDDDFVTYKYNAKTKISNFSAALLLKIYACDYLSLDLGAQPSFCFRATKEGKRGIEQFKIAYNDNDEYNSLNFCATGGLTGYYGNFFLSARYSIGFTDILKTKTPALLNDEKEEIYYTYSEAKSTTSSVQFTLGYRFK